MSSPPPTNIGLHCVIFGEDTNHVFIIDIPPKATVYALKKLIFGKEEANLKTRVKRRSLALFQLDLPWHNELLLDEFKRKILCALPVKCLQVNHTLDKIFPLPLNNDNLHIVIVPPDVAQEAIVGSLENQYGALFERLQVVVSNPGAWKESDVTNNLKGGEIITPDMPRPLECEKMAEFEEKLNQHRTYTRPVGNRDGSLEFRQAREQYPGYFSLIFKENDSMDDGLSAPVATDSSSDASDQEFATFFNILRHHSGDSAHIKTDRSSALKAGYLAGAFMFPPFYSPSSSILYQVDTSWAFPIFVTRMDQQRLYYKYTPGPDIMVQSTSFIPLIISEVVSEGAETDRARMQIQAIALVRAGQFLIDDGEQFFVVAIYLTKNLIAERYIVAQPSTSNEKVFMHQKNFDLSDPTGAVLFLREMYNLAPKLEELAGKFNLGDHGLLARIQKAASGLLSLTAAFRGRGRPATDPLPAVAEDGENDVAGDGSGVAGGNYDGPSVFGADDIQHILGKMGYRIDFILFGHPLVAFVSNAIDRSKTGFLKFVKEGRNEIPILQYLSKINSPRNHTIPNIQFWPVRGGQVISMPSAGIWVTDLKNLDAQLWSMAGQLFEAIDFMHQHGVAHLDLKPANIIIPSAGGRLSIIDFHTSVCVKDADTMFRGVVGTVGYIPPEVEADRGRFSAVRADLWSCGKILDELCDLCQPSADCDKLLQIAQELMDKDPKKRPMMFDVLERMAQYKAGGNQGAQIGNIADT